MSVYQSIYRIKRFTSSKDRDFIKALKIYNDSIAVHSKTDTNEITTFLDKKTSSKREMLALRKNLCKFKNCDKNVML